MPISVFQNGIPLLSPLFASLTKRISRNSLCLPHLQEMRDFLFPQNAEGPGLGDRGLRRNQPDHSRGRLERKLRGKLQTARAAAAEIRITDADITRGRQVQRAATAARRYAIARRAWQINTRPGCNSLLTCVGDEVRQIRIGKVWMVKDVVTLKAELHVQSLGQLRPFEE